MHHCVHFFVEEVNVCLEGIYVFLDGLVAGVCVFDLFSGDCFALGNRIDDFSEGRNAVIDHLVGLDELG